MNVLDLEHKFDAKIESELKVKLSDEVLQSERKNISLQDRYLRVHRNTKTLRIIVHRKINFAEGSLTDGTNTQEKLRFEKLFLKTCQKGETHQRVASKIQQKRPFDHHGHGSKTGQENFFLLRLFVGWPADLILNALQV